VNLPDIVRQVDKPMPLRQVANQGR
jgi:hypothetical protein